MSDIADHLRVERAFLTIGDRQVHYRRIGKGPPALFIHSSPTNSSFIVEDMQAHAENYTCFAFDTPGFGLSDPLPLDEMLVADLADATAEAMDALGLPPLPVFGTHTGAAIALELGFRHPAKVTGLVLDGLPMFTREEVAPMVESVYFAPLEADVLGGHFASTWTRYRDQSIWFPWCFRDPANLNEYDLGDPESIHRWTEMFFAAAPYYKAAYRAAVTYCENSQVASAGLTVPAFFTATPTDMLYSHLQRLPPLRANQAIVEIGTDKQRKFRLVADGFAQFGSPGVAPATGFALHPTGEIRRQCVTIAGHTCMVRYLGDPANPATLLLHDTPGSSQSGAARMREMAQNRFVIAPDIPGSGESDPLDEQAGMDAYATAIWQLCDALGVDAVAIEGRGFGASLAVEMACAGRGRCTALAIDGLLLPDPAERSDLLANYAPPVEIERDGSHWYRLWLRLRDSLVYWPWYDTRRVALRRAPTVFDAGALHQWAVETMKQREGYPRFLNAALRHDAAARLAVCGVVPSRINDPLSALGNAYGAALDALLATQSPPPGG